MANGHTGMQVGKCGLCLRSLPLCRSHLLPAELYRRIREPRLRHPDPVLTRRGVAISSSIQAVARLLCGACERRMNDLGERTSLALLPQMDGTFPLQSLLLAATPVLVTDCEKIYSGRKTLKDKTEHLIHFGGGIFWKAAAFDWRPHAQKLPLGPYAEPLRLFLKGDEEFPNNMALWVSVWQEEVDHPWISSPHLVYRDKIRSYRFDAMGACFLLVVGAAIREEITAYDIVRGSGNPIMLSPLARTTSIVAQVLSGSVARPSGLLSSPNYREDVERLGGLGWSAVRKAPRSE